MEIIIPCAGLSSRFPNMKPKYLLADKRGKLMLEKVIENLLDYKIWVILLREHEEKFGSILQLRNVFGDKLKFVILDERTNGPAETVYQALHYIDILGGFLIRDCDSYYDCEINDGNFVYVDKTSSLSSNIDKSKLGYVMLKNHVVQEMREKQEVAEYFCVGGYQFLSKNIFINAYDNKDSFSGEIYISNIINACIKMGHNFNIKNVNNYVNVGDLDNWCSYNSKICKL
jgi:dTDP-glucose pyrophosphorylase